MTTAGALFIRAVMHGRDGFVPAVLVAALEETGAGARSPRCAGTTWCSRHQARAAHRQVVDGHTSGPGGRLERLVDQPLTTRTLGTGQRVASALRSLPDRPGGRVGAGD